MRKEDERDYAEGLANDSTMLAGNFWRGISLKDIFVGTESDEENEREHHSLGGLHVVNMAQG